MAGSTQQLYLMPDVKGSTRLVTDAGGVVQQSLSYDAFGNRTDGGGTALVDLFYAVLDPRIRPT